MQGATSSKIEDPRTYMKRPGTNANEGFLYEIRICMLLILRCVAQGLKFKLKCNVEDEEKLFDDVVCKITKPVKPGPDQVKRLFLQAKHYTGQKTSIFKVKDEKRNIGDFPTAAITKWFESFQILSKKHPDGHFEMVFYTTIGIEKDLKQFFTPCKSDFTNILLCDPKQKDSVWCLKPEYLVGNLAMSKVERNNFCESLKIIVLQPLQEKLGENIEMELPMPDPKRKVIYNEACSFIEAWHNAKDTAVIINTDIYAEAEMRTNLSVFKNLLSSKETVVDFLYNPTTISDVENLLYTEQITAFQVESFDTYIDLFKQIIRCKQEVNSSFVFTFAEFQDLRTTEFSNFKSYRNKIFIIVKLSDQDITVNKDIFRSKLEELRAFVSQVHDIQVTFLAKLSPESWQLSESLQLCLKTYLLTFTKLALETKQRVLGCEVEFMGEKNTLRGLDMDPNILIDEKMLAECREGKPIKIGEPLPKSNFNPNTYISRTLKAFNNVGKDFAHENELIVTNTKDKFIIVDDTLTETQGNPDQAGTTRQIMLTEGGTVCTKSQEKSTSAWTEDDLIEKHICQPMSTKVVLVSSNPGMGKSQLAHSLTRKLIRRAMWPIFVNLNQCNELLKCFEKSNSSRGKSPICILEQFVEPEDLKNFEKFLHDPRKVVFLFDGLDEISTEHVQVVFSLVDSISKSNVKNIIILTRQHLADEVRQKTGALLVHLSEFIKSDIQNFLHKHYNHKKIAATDRLDKFIYSLLDLIFSKSRSYWMEVTGVPLQTYMVAEVFRERCETYVRRTGPDTEAERDALLSEEDADIDLYERLIEQKIRIFVLEKSDAKETKATITQMRKSQPRIVEEHTTYGILLIFGYKSANNLFGINVREILDMPLDEICSYGIVTSTGNNIEFIHRSFAEYLCAWKITDILFSADGSMEQRRFIYSSVLALEQYTLIRKFVDMRMSKKNEELCIHLKHCTPEVCIKHIFHLKKNQTDTDQGRANSRPVFNTDPADSTRVLQVACREGNAHITRKLLDLRHQEGGAELVDSLLQYPHRYGYTPVHMALRRGHLALVSMLLDSGVDLNLPGYEERTALHIAAEAGHDAVVQLLLDRGADREARDRNGLTPLHRAAGEGRTSLLRLLVESGCKVDVRARNGSTSLHYAAQSGHAEAVRVSVQLGAGINVGDNHGDTPLHWAAYWGKLECVHDLLELGAELNPRNQTGQTPLHLAAGRSYTEIVRMFIEHGAGVEKRDNAGNTPLHLAAAPDTLTDDVDNSDTARVLLDNNAELNARNQAGQSPLTVAREMDRTHIAGFLESRGATV